MSVPRLGIPPHCVSAANGKYAGNANVRPIRWYTFAAQSARTTSRCAAQSPGSWPPLKMGCNKPPRHRIGSAA
eukprot:7742855-Alexandrium_andersonii.AAC.1